MNPRTYSFIMGSFWVMAIAGFTASVSAFVNVFFLSGP